jgi:hypothetical protein
VKRSDAQPSWGRNQVRKVLLCVRSKERKCGWEALMMVAYENGPWGLNSLQKTFNGLNKVRLGLWCVRIKWHAFQMRNKYSIAWSRDPCPFEVKKVWIVEAWFNIIYWLISKPKFNVVVRIAKWDLRCKYRRQRKPLSLIPCVGIAQRKITLSVWKVATSDGANGHKWCDTPFLYYA